MALASSFVRTPNARGQQEAVRPLSPRYPRADPAWSSTRAELPARAEPLSQAGLSHKQLSQKLWETAKNRQLAHLGPISIGNEAAGGMETLRETLFYLISPVYMNALMKRHNNGMNCISQQTGQTSTDTTKLGRTEKIETRQTSYAFGLLAAHFCSGTYML